MSQSKQVGVLLLRRRRRRVCTSCGRVLDAGAASFVHHQSHTPYRDNKLAAASALITSTATRLGLSPTRADEVLRMAKSATTGKEQGASKRKQWRRGLELDPWMDWLGDGWTKDMALEEVADIDIGYNAPPPSFTAGMELQKRRRARIEVAKCRIDAIRKAPSDSAANPNNTQAVLGNEDACPPQKLVRKK